MERGIYFDSWYKNIYCYHPSLPLRNMQMIEDIEKYRGTILLWSILGGGSISLPWLEHEAFGDVDPRLRFYGFLNDSEFIAECGKRGIKVFGIVFEVQGWEFPAVITDRGGGKSAFKGINLLREEDEKEHDWYGLGEFTSDKHWEIFGKKFADYFPDGLYDSNGKLVTNIMEEGCSRTYAGEPVHAGWVEVVDHKHVGYQMCRNNLVWRTYLKKIIEIMIDAGVQGVQLDEPELPMISIFDKGCFCIDCVKEFRAYLQAEKAAGKLPELLAKMDLTDFDYGVYLRESGREFPKFYDDLPFSQLYREYQLRAVKGYFKELADYVRAYSLQTKGESVLVSANFTFIPICFPLWEHVDIVMTEMRVPTFKKPAWYRYMAGFGGDKQVIIAESPGGIIPELVEMLDKGQGHDLYRTFLLEPAIFGCNMSVPYGSWMGNSIKNAFHPPRHVTIEIQDFLADHDRLFGFNSGADVAVIWSYPSYYWRENVAGYSTEFVDGEVDEHRLPFWEVIDLLSEQQICYDVLLTADGEMREDTFELATIHPYPVLVLADCVSLTKKQADVIASYAEIAGNTVLVYGRIAENIPSLAKQLRDKSNVVFCQNSADAKRSNDGFVKVFSEIYDSYGRVWVDDTDVGFHTFITADGHTALHLINYNYDKVADRVNTIDEFTVTVKGTGLGEVVLHTPCEPQREAIEIKKVEDKDKTTYTIKKMPLYIVLELDAII